MNSRLAFPPPGRMESPHSSEASSPAALMMPPPRSPHAHISKPMFKVSKISLNSKTAGSSMNLGARWGHSSCLVEDRRLFIIGGIGNNLVHDTCLFDFGTMSWIEAHAAGKSPGARYGHSTVLLTAPSVLEKTCILLFGGRNISKKYFNDLYLLDTATLTWTCFPSDKNFPDPRAGHSSVLMRHPSLSFARLVIFGGNYHNKYLNSVYIMDIISSDNFQWYKPSVKGTPPCPRSGHTCTHIPGTTKMLVFGGFDGKKCFNDVYIFCTVTFTWTNIMPFGIPPRPRSGHTASLVADRYWVIFGGCADAVFLNDFHILDLKAGASSEIVLQWLSQPTLPLTIAPRFHHSCDTVDHSIIIFGGCASGALFNDMISLDVSPLLEPTDRPTTTTTITNGGPSSRPAAQAATNSVPAPSSSTTSTTSASTSVSQLQVSTPSTSTTTTTPSATATSTADPTTSPSSPVSTSQSTSSETSALDIANTTPTSSSQDPSTPESDLTSASDSSHTTSSSSSQSASPSSSSPSLHAVRHVSAPPLTLLHAVTPDFDISDAKRSFSSPLKFSSLQDDGHATESPASPLEICLTSALASLSSEQQKLKEMELFLARERAAHASLRADYVSEQIKVKELEERLHKAEKQLRKSQRVATDGKSHSHAELQKAHTQISSLRADLSKMTDKYESEHRAYLALQASSSHEPASPQRQAPKSQANVEQQLDGFIEACTLENLSVLELPALTRLQTSTMRASEIIAAAKDKKLEQLIASLESMRIDLAAKEQQHQEKEEELNVLSKKFSHLEEEHAKDKENLRHLVGEDLENMDPTALEKLEEIHHTGLRSVGTAKTKALAQQVARLQREKDELAERVVCVVCADAQINTVLSPCGHRCMCKGCADLLSCCPLCRKPIAGKLQYFP